LEGIVLNERALEWMEILAISQPFDGDDLRVLKGDGEAEAARDSSTIYQDSTRATLAMVATLLRTGNPKALAQCVQERRTGING
jgi:hypothetical protein